MPVVLGRAPNFGEEHPLLLILIFLGVLACGAIALLVLDWYLKKRYPHLAADPFAGSPAKSVPALVAGAEKGRQAAEILRAADPSFRGSDFVDWARKAYAAVQAARAARDLRILRPYVSDGTYERFALQIEELESTGCRELIEKLDFREVQPVAATSKALADAAVVYFRLVSVEYRASLADGKILLGSRRPRETSEFWTFLRIRSPAGTVPTMVSCPGCGARIWANPGAPCGSCGMAVRRGHHNWVLSEITRPEAWRADDEGGVLGLPGLRASDPGFTLASLEDRASVLFWRQARCERLGNVAPLLPFSTEEFVERMGADMAVSAPEGNRGWWADRSVGCVETERILSVGDRHRAIVKIVWRGTRYESNSGGTGKAVFRGGVMSTLLVLERGAGVPTVPGTALFYAHCPSCGAPAPGAGKEGGRCLSCGTTRNDGNRDWVLAGCHPWDSAEAKRAMADGTVARAGAGPSCAAPAPGTMVSRRLFVGAVAVAAADGTLFAPERATLDRLGSRCGLRPDAAAEWIDAALREGGLPPLPSGPAEARVWMEELAAVALADGCLDAGEESLIRRIAASAGVAEAETGEILGRARAKVVAGA